LPEAGIGVWQGGRPDDAKLRREVTVVIAGDIRVETAEAEALEQMRLPQIADVVIDAAGLGPARHRPDLAREQQQAEQAANDLQRFHVVRRKDVGWHH
jgi:hypothetical protein